jgi:hypothetical protein
MQAERLLVVKEQSIVAQTRAESEQLQREANEVLLAEKAVVSQLKREMTALENKIELLNETLVALKEELAEGNNTVSTALPTTPPCCCCLPLHRIYQ